MKKLLILYIIIFATAITINVCCSKRANKSYNELFVEALADGEKSTVEVSCYCALLSSQNCAVNNHSSYLCAGGPGVMCAEYDTNCN